MPNIETAVVEEDEKKAADLFLEHNGIHLFYTYVDIGKYSFPSYYYLTLDPYDTEMGERCVDVYSLSTFTPAVRPMSISTTFPEDLKKQLQKEWQEYRAAGTEAAHIKTVLIAAIDKGEIKPSDEETQHRVKAALIELKEAKKKNLNFNHSFNVFPDALSSQDKFTNLKVYPVQRISTASVGKVEQCEESEADFYCIYAKRASGELVCIADCQDRAAADMLFMLLNKVMNLHC